VETLRTQSPDGRKWEVSVSRIRLPSWHHSTFHPDEGSDYFVLAFEYLILAPLFWFIFPLIRAIVLFPIAIVRSLFSSTRWVEAVCRDPAEIRIVWKTKRAGANQIAAEIASRLRRGYEDLTPPEAEFVSMTEPPGLEERDA
jgi:hypothetical protein